MESENAVVKNEDEIIQIASFEIGAFRQNEISWKVKEDAVYVVGRRTSVWNQHTGARVEGGRFSRVIPIPDQVCRDSISARFVGGGLFVVEGTKKIEKVKRNSSQTAYFDDMGFCVSVQVEGRPANLLSAELDNKITDSDTNSESNLHLTSSNGSCSNFVQKKLPSFDSFEEDAELFFRDDPLDVILKERRDSLLLGKERSSATS